MRYTLLLFCNFLGNKTFRPAILIGLIACLFQCTSELCNANIAFTGPHCIYESDESTLENKRDFFIVGSRGTLLHSKNSIDWFKKSLPWDRDLNSSQPDFLINRALFSITYGNNMLVAVGDWGYVFVSLDRGKTWERANRSALKLNEDQCPPRLRNCFAIFKDIQYGNGWFIGVGAGTIIGRSRNPFGPWEFYDSSQLPFGNNQNQFLGKIAYGSGANWIIQLTPPTGENIRGMLYSHNNGRTWNFFNPLEKANFDCYPSQCNTFYNEVLFAKGRFMAVASIGLPPSTLLTLPESRRAVATIMLSETGDPSGAWLRDSYGDFDVHGYRGQIPLSIATDQKGTYIGTQRNNIFLNRFAGENGWRPCLSAECDSDTLRGSDDIVEGGTRFLGHSNRVFYFNKRWFILQDNGHFAHSTNAKRWTKKKIANYQLNDMVGI